MSWLEVEVGIEDDEGKDDDGRLGVWWLFVSSVVNAVGPGLGARPSRRAFAISAAFHLAYRAFSACF
jgi:hypothetical protein